MSEKVSKTTIFARIGVTMSVTEQETSQLMKEYTDAFHKRNQCIQRLIEDGRITVEGDCYFPYESVDDANEAFGTEYEPGEYEFSCPEGTTLVSNNPNVPMSYVIDTLGLEEEIRCAMCENRMHTDRGCDGACKYDTHIYKKVLDVLEKRIKQSSQNCEEDMSNERFHR